MLRDVFQKTMDEMKATMDGPPADQMPREEVAIETVQNATERKEMNTAPLSCETTDQTVYFKYAVYCMSVILP